MKRILQKLLCLIIIMISFGSISACSGQLTKIELINPENFEEIEYGGVINWNNLKIKATYSDGKILSYKYSEIKRDLEIDLGEFKSTMPGTYPIELKYKEKTLNFEITVKDPVVSGIFVDRSLISETINIEKITTEFKANFRNKLIVRAFRTNGTSFLLEQNDYSVLNYDIKTNSHSSELDLSVLNDIGEHWFSVCYGNITPKLFSIRVKLGDENGFLLDLSGIGEEISVGESVDFSKISVYATFSDGRKVLLDSDEFSVDYSEFNNLVAGEYTITISYKIYPNKSFIIKVSE